MKSPFAYVVPGLAAIAIGGAVALAPVAAAAVPAAPTTSITASADVDPLVPYGTEPTVPGRIGYVDSNHDEANTTNGQVDLPF